MRNKLTVNDLPADVVERMKKIINEDRQMLKLRERHASFLRSHRYMEAMKLKQMMDGIEKRVINQYLSEYEGMSGSMECTCWAEENARSLNKKLSKYQNNEK